MELALLDGAREAEVPVWGVCRGIQVLNVFLGGTLWQDLALQLPNQVLHQLSIPARRPGPRGARGRPHGHARHAARPRDRAGQQPPPPGGQGPGPRRWCRSDTPPTAWWRRSTWSRRAGGCGPSSGTRRTSSRWPSSVRCGPPSRARSDSTKEEARDERRGTASGRRAGGRPHRQPPGQAERPLPAGARRDARPPRGDRDGRRRRRGGDHRRRRKGLHRRRRHRRVRGPQPLRPARGHGEPARSSTSWPRTPSR